MYAMICDETNARPSKQSRFLIYGGLLVPLDNLREMHNCIARIRRKAGYGLEDVLKFDTRARPDHVSIEAATEAKISVVQTCLELGCVFIAAVTHHEIAKYQEPDEKILTSANVVLARFNEYLELKGQDGIAVFDNLPDGREYPYFRERFGKGLDFRSRRRPLDHVLMFSSSCIGAVHAMSAADIVLGSFRYCVNDPKNREAACDMFGQVIELMWHEREGRTYRVMDRGLVFRPKTQDVRRDNLRAEYESLFDHLNSLLAEAGRRRARPSA